MYVIETESIGVAHERIIQLILREGEEIKTKHGLTLELPEPVTVHLSNPFVEPRVSSCSSFTAHMAEYYKTQLLTVLPKQNNIKDFDYNCGNRWFDYPTEIETSHGITTIGDGDGYGLNQINKMVCDELSSDKSSRRAIVISISPMIDITKTHIPCITLLQFLIRNNRINMIVYIRSNDMLSAWGADAYALSGVLNYVGNKLKIPLGYLETISASAHIYQLRDHMELLRFRKKLNL